MPSLLLAFGGDRPAVLFVFLVSLCAVGPVGLMLHRYGSSSLLRMGDSRSPFSRRQREDFKQRRSRGTSLRRENSDTGHDWANADGDSSHYYHSQRNKRPPYQSSSRVLENLTEIAYMDVESEAGSFLYNRTWLSVPLKDGVPPTKLRVLQFNILADCMASPPCDDINAEPQQLEGDTMRPSMRPPPPVGSFGLFKYIPGEIKWRNLRRFLCDKKFLVWRRRLPLLLHEITRVDPDVICLQEVDRYEELYAYLHIRGFEGSFVKKSHRAKDGCAVFWKTSKLTNTAIEYVTLHAENVHVAMMLRMKVSARRSVIIVNTHLKAGLDQSYEDFRVEQLKCLLEKVKDFQQDSEDVILCGDLNSHVETYDNIKPIVYSFLKHCGFKNAYGREPGYTHWGAWTDCEVKTIFDYILYLGRIKVLRVLQVPPEAIVGSCPDRLPNQQYPSDHISLVADLQLVDDVDNSKDGSEADRTRKNGAAVRGSKSSSSSSSSSSQTPIHSPIISLSSIAHSIRYLLERQG